MKERIIGAIVLVLFVVLVVPVFLDGPSNNGETITRSVPLPGQAGDENQVIILERDRTEPVPAAGSDAAPEADTEADTEAETTAAAEPPPQQQPAPAVAQTVAETPPPKALIPASTTGMWAVQLGSFGNQANAEKLAADLRKQGFAAFLSQLSTETGELQRVRIGPQKDRESAEAMAERLQKAGHKGQVVPHP